MRNKSESKSTDRKAGKRGKSIADLILLLFLILSLGTTGFCGYKLYSIYSEYRDASMEYDDIKKTVIKERKLNEEIVPEIPEDTGHGESSTQEAGTDSSGNNTGVEKKRVYKAPISVDFGELKAINEDVVAWLYVEAIPDINYPVVQSEDNDYYLHRTYRREDNFAGTLFIDYENSSDFSDSNTILYGHNMKDGSMFGQLKQFRLQETFDRNPYIWLLTPEGDYKYKVFSAYVTPLRSETYNIIKGAGDLVVDYLKAMRGVSEIDTGGQEFDIFDKCLTLSTCTGDSNTRYVVQAVRMN